MIGPSVAAINDQKSKFWVKNDGKNSVGAIMPTNKLFEKSGVGNNKNPKIKPKTIEIYAVFSLIFLL